MQFSFYNWVLHKRLFLLMSVFTQAFFSLVSSHLVPFSFFTAWHNLQVYYFNFALIVVEKDFAGLNAGIL